MLQYNLQLVAEIMRARFLQQAAGNNFVEHLLIDSRRVIHPPAALFFAIATVRRDGHDFIKEAYNKGVRSFTVEKEIDVQQFPEASFLLVDDTLKALQQLAAYHRRQFSIPVIGITGSNGKTIVKEWLYQLLNEQYSIARSPKSYNSQVGVPLSVWQLQPQHTLAIFEAGISQKNEMNALQEIIQPTIGILTNIGEAHAEGFADAAEKLREKQQLFSSAETVICSTEKLEPLSFLHANIYNWGFSANNALVVKAINRQLSETTIVFSTNTITDNITIPFVDDASIENAVTCLAVCMYLQVSFERIKEKFQQLRPVSLRLELKSGIHNTTIINDSYSADLSSLTIALNMLQQQGQHLQRTVIISDFQLTPEQETATYRSIAELLLQHKVQRLLTVGPRTKALLVPLLNSSINSISFDTTPALAQQIENISFQNETILLKGARVFELDSIAQLLEQKTHQTVLEINLSAITRNIRAHQQLLKPSTKIMAMVKAFSYGSGSYEIANLLQFMKADYLAVAFTDEGVALRKAGISLPIMVMNPEPVTFDALIDYNLEPELFSFSILHAFESFLEKEGINSYPVHIKIDTGMHRLGFMPSELEELVAVLNRQQTFSIQSVFSHLAASEDPAEDAFTLQQAMLFEDACSYLENALGYPFLKHLDNSNGTIRHRQLQFDMVRLGIGMYGISSAAAKLQLEEALTLKTTIAQIKQLQPGDTVGYNRRGVITKPSVIATVRIGYADGYPRNLSNGVGYMLVHGQKAPVIGTVCMDMTMLDITDLVDVKEGDEVIVFGPQLSVTTVAKQSGTIAYEVMTGINQRVKRIYYEE
ncbi:bifunctional UDP-N-acetylmuramoyl-tripeptide:D-alanyl-D-alanine ligase/alanine racemase [Lacibacter luteus]|uniref:Alanine racemase n=1 Tax=Lacibacter luteus TaxID=2508719 RepID=A0A4Q1CGL8_9BACT|nr:bifunctional UDP-N-acetylmuramoyl-tripeptide:D-alanyl-D-alanine ligase/alanine racemase [Lacibacter luteus]RXK59309.1 bifunctional UDP-N-acetylmuramoyl-tripeptide:D-alanyl-D-alanine ligase/alanine racemase [Lacibacter luteus]